MPSTTCHTVAGEAVVSTTAESGLLPSGRRYAFGAVASALALRRQRHEEVQTEPTPLASRFRSFQSFPPRNLQQRVALWIGAGAFLLSLVLGFAVGRAAQSRLEAEAGRGLAQAARLASETLDRSVTERTRGLELAANLLGDSSPPQPLSPQTLLEAERRTYPAYAWIGFQDVAGKVRASAGVLSPDNEFSVSTLVRDAASGRQVGQVVARLRWDRVADEVSSPTGTEMILLSPSGALLTVTPPLQPGQGDQFRQLPAAFLRQVRNAEQGYSYQKWQGDTEPYLVGYAMEQGNDPRWVVLVRQPAKATLAASQLIYLQMLLIAVPAGILAAVGCWHLVGRVVIGRFAEPARAVADAADRIRAGDHSTPLPQVEDSDDLNRVTGALGDLAGTLTQQAEKLAQREAELVYTNRRLEQANRRLEQELREREQMLADHEKMLAERSHLLAVLQVGAVRQRRLLRDLLCTATDNRLRLCDEEEDLPKRLPELVTEPILLTKDSLRTFRHTADKAATDLEMSVERRADLLLAVGEAAMNAVVHGGGGVGAVFHDGEGRVQVWVVDRGKGISEQNLPRATLEKGFTTAGTMGHGFPLILRTCDRLYLLTGTNGTTLVLEQNREEPQMDWLTQRGFNIPGL